MQLTHDGQVTCRHRKAQRCAAQVAHVAHASKKRAARGREALERRAAGEQRAQQHEVILHGRQVDRRDALVERALNGCGREGAQLGATQPRLGVHHRLARHRLEQPHQRRAVWATTSTAAIGGGELEQHVHHSLSIPASSMQEHRSHRRRPIVLVLLLVVLLVVLLVLLLVLLLLLTAHEVQHTRVVIGA